MIELIYIIVLVITILLFCYKKDTRNMWKLKVNPYMNNY